MTKWLTVAQYAKHRGVDRRRVYYYIEHGNLEGCLRDGKRGQEINRDKADAALEQNLDKISNRPGSRPNGKESNQRRIPEDAAEKTRSAGTSGMSLADAQKIQAQYKAALMKLEYEEKNKTLVKVDQVEADFFNIARRVRDSILNIPDRISAELASTTDTHLVSERLTNELIAALEELSRES